MPEPALRVALLGYGLAGRGFHAPLLAAAGLRLAAVVTADAGRSAQAAAEHPGAVVLGSAAHLWERTDTVDLAVVATTTVTHVPLALEALDAGLPAVVDKPLAVTAGEGRRVLERAGERGLLLTVFQNRRWDAEQLTLRRLLADATLGEVTRFESRFERWRPERTPGKWREELAAELGGGVLLDLGSHLVDQAVALFGPVARVYAELAAHRGGADDEAFLALTHAGGVRSHLSVGHLAGAPGPRLRVLGTRGAYVVDSLDGQEAALAAGVAPGEGWGIEPPQRWGRLVRGGEAEPVPSERGRWDSFYPAVARALREGGPPPVDPRDSVGVLQVLDAARASAASGQTVDLPNPLAGPGGPIDPPRVVPPEQERAARWPTS